MVRWKARSCVGGDARSLGGVGESCKLLGRSPAETVTCWWLINRSRNKQPAASNVDVNT